MKLLSELRGCEAMRKGYVDWAHWLIFKVFRQQLDIIYNLVKLQ